MCTFYSLAAAERGCMLKAALPLLLCSLLLFVTNWASIGAEAAYNCNRGYPITGTPVWDFDVICNYSTANWTWSSRSNPLNIQNATINQSVPASSRTIDTTRQLYRTVVSSGRKIKFPSINPSLYPNASGLFLCAIDFCQSVCSLHSPNVNKSRDDTSRRIVQCLIFCGY